MKIGIFYKNEDFRQETIRRLQNKFSIPHEYILSLGGLTMFWDENTNTDVSLYHMSRVDGIDESVKFDYVFIEPNISWEYIDEIQDIRENHREPLSIDMYLRAHTNLIPI